MYQQLYLVKLATALVPPLALNPQHVGHVPAWERFAHNKGFLQLSEPAQHVLVLDKSLNLLA
jgi:hypothetical protein